MSWISRLGIESRRSSRDLGLDCRGAEELEYGTTSSSEPRHCDLETCQWDTLASAQRLSSQAGHADQYEALESESIVPGKTSTVVWYKLR